MAKIIIFLALLAATLVLLAAGIVNGSVSGVQKLAGKPTGAAAEPVLSGDLVLYTQLAAHTPSTRPGPMSGKPFAKSWWR